MPVPINARSLPPTTAPDKPVAPPRLLLVTLSCASPPDSRCTLLLEERLEPFVAEVDSGQRPLPSDWTWPILVHTAEISPSTGWSDGDILRLSSVATGRLASPDELRAVGLRCVTVITNLNVTHRGGTRAARRRQERGDA
jgi:hypothetical protein